MPARYVTVNVVAELLDHDHGHWCPTCLLSTGVRAWVAVRFGDRMHLQMRTHCTECGSRNITLDPNPRHC
jgi:hypothetical protein